MELEKLVSKYPDIDNIVNFRGTIGEFYETFKTPMKAPSEFRSKKLIESVIKAARRVFGEDEMCSIRKSLEQNYLVSTAEHHASITHPETLNVVLNQFLIQKKYQLPTISLSCATTTLENDLFPRGVFFREEKLPFISKNYKSCFAANSPPMNESTFLGRVNELLKKSRINIQEAEYLTNWFINEFYALRDLPSLSAQISRLNQRLWKLFIDSDLKYENFNYFMIPAEEVVENFLCEDIISGQKSWVYQCLFDENTRKRIVQVLDKTKICWDLENGKGTLFFWGYNDRLRPVQLFLNENYLVSKCNTIKVPMTPEAILEALKRRSIVPASSLCCLYLAFYCGLTLMGGILQINYLGDMKRALMKNNPLNLDTKDLEIIKNVWTNYYVNFQKSSWNAGGLMRIIQPMSANDLQDYQMQDHFNQVQECLQFLTDI